MQAQISVFDVLGQKPSADCLKNITKTAGQEKGAARVQKTEKQMDAFMEIMSTLLGLPKEQLQDPAAALKTAASGDNGDAAAADPKIDPALQGLDLSQLLQMLLGPNVPVQNLLTGDQEEQIAPSIKQALLSFLAHQTPSTGQQQELPVQDWKAKWAELVKQLKLPGENQKPGAAPEAPGLTGRLAAQSQLQMAEVISAANRKPAGHINARAGVQLEVVPGPGLDAEGPAVDQAVGLERLTTGKKEAAGGGGNRPLSASQVQAKTNVATPAQNPVPAAGPQNSPGEKVPSNAGEPNPDQGKHKFQLETSVLAATDGPERDSLVRTPTADGAQSGLFSRLEARSDQGLTGLSGQKAVLPSDKEMQTDVIRQIVQRMSLNTQSGQSKMTIQLKPEHLGNVNLQVLTEDHQVSVRMTTDSAAVKQIIEQNIQHLRLGLQHHGLEIQKFDVFVGNDNSGRQSSAQQDGFRQALRQRQQRSAGNPTAVPGAQAASATQASKATRYLDPNEIDYFA
jgi:flagellar hook-length control protein FliK